MPTTTVRWIRSNDFIGIDTTNHSVVISGSDSGIGVKPSQLLLIALSACSGVDVVEILRKKRMPVEMLEIVASGENDPEPPWAYRRIHVRYTLSGKGLTPKAVQQAIALSQNKYCSVSATVRSVAEITTEFEIRPPAEA
jgi:putative redox protein